MKRIITLIALLLATAAARAQAYHPFPTHHTIWGEFYSPHMDSNFRIVYYGLLNDDTVIGGRTYHKLYRSADTVFQQSEYYGALREDSAARRVYLYGRGFFGPGSNGETLLYDFSVQQGDTLKGGPGDNWRVDMIAGIVDSVNIAGQYRKRIYLNFPGTTPSPNSRYPSIWVEGMGNIGRGLLFSSGTYPTNGTWSELVCMKQDGSWFYHHANGWAFPSHIFPPCDELLLENQVQVGEVQLNDRDIRFAPNPVTGTSYLQLLTPGKFETLELFTVTGNRISTVGLRGRTEVQLQHGMLAPGAYYYRLTGKGGAAVRGKFLVE